MNDVCYTICDVEPPGREREYGGGTTELWQHSRWLTGPVQRLLLTSTEFDGGDVSVSGRSSEVTSTGSSSITARAAQPQSGSPAGAFGLVARGDHLKAGYAPELVRHDAMGQRSSGTRVQADGETEHCNARPDGKRIYRQPSSGCQPRREVGTVAPVSLVRRQDHAT